MEIDQAIGLLHLGRKVIRSEIHIVRPVKICHYMGDTNIDQGEFVTHGTVET